MTPVASPTLISPITASGLNPGQAEAVRQLDIWLEGNHKWFLLEALPGRGKEQPVSEPVLTPSGWSTMGQLQVGSQVIGSSGQPINVLQIHPQGVKDVYTVTLGDGSKVRCGLDHLWTVKPQSAKAKTISLSEIIKDYQLNCPSKTIYRYALPEFTGLQNGKSIDYAYALGYMLGNGCFSQSQLAISCHSDVEEDLLIALEPSLGRPTKSRNTSINGRQSLYCWLKVDSNLLKYCQSGLSGDKRLLEDDNNWLAWDYESRLNLLKGLLDSDGSIQALSENKRFKMSFSSTSESLITLVRDLIRSLGGRCCEPCLEKRQQQYKSGYGCVLHFRMPVCPVKLYLDKWQSPQFSMAVTIVNIEKEEYQEESVCISVDAEDMLYVTSGFKLTHNSYVIKHWLNNNSQINRNVILTAPTHQALEELAQDIPGVSAQTIHSLLGYRPQATETENQILVRAGSGTSPKLIDYKIVIIDEAFYCPKVLINTIVANYPDVRFIFLGDRQQLSAVNEGQSALIELLPHIRFICGLTEDMRTKCPKQKQFVLDVIDNGWDTDFSPVITTRGKIINQIDKLIESGSRDFVFIAYRHVTVDYWAKQIRQMLYNKEPNEFYSAGEVVRLSGVVDSDNNEIIRNNEIVTIETVCPKENPEFIVVAKGNGDLELLELDFDGKIDKAKKAALAGRDSRLWAHYYSLVRKYPKISSREAITAHSAQGMTRGNVFIDLSDLKREGSKSLLLVAVSRSKNLIKGFW